ncbi:MULTISPECIES: hypothetical protein [Nocardia]|uniref:hypothetical protein n=1 Tax=Nocardia TaxID=1817 RepID=UPI0024558B36|nr:MULTISPECIES: hypothetical protein [Nocardia]
MSIDWDQIGQQRFDRIVEVLITRRYSNAEVIAVNGRGGDGGIDLEVRQGDRLHIFQLKYFPEGFSGGFARSRREQIRRSYNKMVEEKPYEWVLVVPNNLTPTERKFVDGLGKGADTPRRRVIDRTGLDDLLVDFPGVDRWAQRNTTTELFENAKIMNREIDNLLGPDDLATRVGNLGKLADSVDLDWTYDFHRVGDTVTQVLRPQHSRAHIVNPVHITVRAQFGPQHIQLHEQFQRKVRFGTGERVALPPENVKGIEVTGPAHVARQFDSGDVVIDVGKAAPGVGRLMELRFSEEDGTIVSAHEGRITHLGIGTHGYALEATFYDDRLTVRIMFAESPEKQEIPPTAQVSHNIHQARPRVVLDVLGLVRQLRTAHKVEVFIEGNFLLSVLKNGDNETGSDDLILEEFAADLDIVQQHCGQYFALPDSISARDRIEIRVARILIDGGIVAAPQAEVVTLTLSGENSPRLRDTLAQAEVPVVVVHENYTVSLGGRVLPLGPVWVFHHAASPVDSASVIAALDAGEAAGLKVDFVPTHDPYFFVASAELPEDRLHNQPQTLWELNGITQPRQDRPLAAVDADNPSPIPAVAETGEPTP